MSSPVTDVIAQIATDWEATTPPDLTAIGYRYADAVGVDPESIDADRAFWFDLPERVEVIAETSASTLVAWQVTATVVLSDNGRSPAEFTAAVANESNLLARQIESRTTWPTDVWAVQTDSVSVERDDETGAALMTFVVDVLTGEAA